MPTLDLPQQIIRVQPKGVLTLPKKWREEIGIEENGMVRVIKDNRRLIIEPVRMLPYPVRGYTDKDLTDFYTLDEEETNRLREKGFINGKTRG